MTVRVDEIVKDPVVLFLKLKNWLDKIFIEKSLSVIVRIKCVSTQNCPVLPSLLFLFYTY